MSIVMTILGVLGAALVVLMYAMLERGKIDAGSVTYYAINGIGAFLILISLAYDFDFADMGGIVLEICWLVVSFMGIFRVFSRGTKAPPV